MAERLSDPFEDDAATERLPQAGPQDPSGPKLLGSTSFFRLWLAQVVSSLGDWIGLFAILSLSARVGRGSPEAAIALVMSARMIPGFFLASVGGVLVDRWDRRKVMVACDVGRGLVLATLPFVDTVWGLFLASLVLEVLTLLWSPAKEASVPNIVKPDKLASANSFSLAAAYGTFPIASALFASLTKVAEVLGRNAGPLDFLRLNQESLAIYFDVGTFFLSAALIWSLTLPRTRPAERAPIDLTRTFTEIKEGWKFIGTQPTVRSVMVGLGTGLIGGGMIAPLGPIYANQVLNAGASGFGLLLTALGMGLAVGVVLVLAAAAVRIYDALDFTSVALQLMAFVTPTFYPLATVSDRFRWAIEANPLTQALVVLRGFAYEGAFAPWWSFAVCLGAGALALAVGIVVFARAWRSSAVML